MDKIISSIIEKFELNDDDITNIYNYGSWVYGTNHDRSDRDFLIVMKIKNENQKKYLKFHEDFDYFHSFDLLRLNNCDITIHSCENFEILLEKNYMLAVECLFYPNEFILKNQIDYKTIYLSKYYNPLRLKQVIFYENYQSLKYIIDDNDNNNSQSTNPTIDQFLCNAIHTTTIEEDRLIKYLFHGLRYLDIGEQLIRTKSIYDFKRVSYVLFQMKHIYLNNNKDINFVIDYIQTKSNEYKTLINELVPTNIINGTFEVHITVDNNDNNMESFLNICNINKLKSLFIHLDNRNNSKQLIAILNYVGIYPNIMKDIQIFLDTHFKDFNILRLKIKSLSSNDNVPENNINKILFWDNESTYFEFNYKIYVKSIKTFEIFKQLCYLQNLYLTHNVFTQISDNDMYYIATIRLFNIGKINAFIENDHLIQYLTNNDFSPIEIKSYFVIYDSDIDLDHRSTPILFNPSRTYSFVNNNSGKYRVKKNWNRKVFRRSTDC